MRHTKLVINVEIIKIHVSQILPYGRVTGNKEFTIDDLIGINRKFQKTNCQNLFGKDIIPKPTQPFFKSSYELHLTI